MFRAIFEFLAMIAMFALARAVISFLLKLVAGGVRGQASQASQDPPRQRASPGTLQSAGELQKDPVCGTFVPVATSLRKVVDGQHVYFCSAECRDQYLVAAK